MYTDFVQNIYVFSYFSLLDMFENLKYENVFFIKENFGYSVLAMKFDENGILG